MSEGLRVHFGIVLVNFSDPRSLDVDGNNLLFCAVKSHRYDVDIAGVIEEILPYLK